MRFLRVMFAVNVALAAVCLGGALYEHQWLGVLLGGAFASTAWMYRHEEHAP